MSKLSSREDWILITDMKKKPWKLAQMYHF